MPNQEKAKYYVAECGEAFVAQEEVFEVDEKGEKQVERVVVELIKMPHHSHLDWLLKIVVCRNDYNSIDAIKYP